MRKLFIAFALLPGLLTSGLTVSAKNKKSEGGFKIGIGGGLNSTWLFNTNVSSMGNQLDYESTLGGFGGLNVSYDFTDKMGLAGGIFYSGQNQKYQLGDISPGVDGEVETSLSYINIPVLFRVGNLGQGFYFEIGPQIGILTGGSEDVTIPGDPADSYSGRNVKSQFNSTDFSGVIGFGGIFNLSDNIAMSAGLRFGYGFSDVTIQHTEADLDALEANGMASFADVAAHTSDKTDPTTHQNLFDYKPTNSAFGGLLISVMYKLQ